MRNLPIINIVCRVKEPEKYFDEHYRSIKMQTHRNIRYWVLFDDKKHIPFLKRYDRLRRVYIDYKKPYKAPILNEKEKIESYWYNDVFKKIDKGWVVFLDEDCVLSDPNCLEKMLKSVKNSNDLCIFQSKKKSGLIRPRLKDIHNKGGEVGVNNIMVNYDLIKKHWFDKYENSEKRFIEYCFKLSGQKKWVGHVLLNKGLFLKDDDVMVYKDLLFNFIDYEYGFNSINKNMGFYDTLIIIPSYNRYENVINIIKQLETQKTKYSFKIIFLDDGSTDKRYKTIPTKYSNVVFHRNKLNNGLKNYWKTFNRLLEEAKDYNTNSIIQMDDDFKLCDGFIDKCMDLFYKMKNENNTIIIRYHLGVLSTNKKNIVGGVDGGTLFDVDFFKLFDYKIDNLSKVAGVRGSYVWQFLNNIIKKHKLKIHYVDKSLVYHVAYNNSKMHPAIRKKVNYKTINYIDK